MRISRDQLFMEMAVAASKRSTCFRNNVGAVLVEDRRRVISIGYNGPPPGEEHCLGNACVPPGKVGCTRALHAEQNALYYAPSQYSSGRHWTMYTTFSPCPMCADLIAQSGIKRVVFQLEYRDPKPVENMLKHGIVVHRLTTSGYLINMEDRSIIENFE